ncbi:MAG: hypothetical protein IPQ07_35845 [Myxococcales bacterium]|nr:hypothetical protein [Myxococcales bacterium]
MPTCRGCNDDVDKLVSVKIAGKVKKLRRTAPIARARRARSPARASR